MTLQGGHFEQPQAVLRAVLESPQGIVIFALDREYRYLAFNENHARTIQHIWGEAVHVGRDMLSLIGREDDREKARVNFDRALAGESFTVLEEYGDVQLGRRFYENVYSPIRDDDGEVIGLTVYLTDITARRIAEQELECYRNGLEKLVQQRTAELEAAHAQLLHVQKLESLGVLAGGIAHDFNNLLTVILGRVELASSVLPPESGARSHLTVAQQTALEARMLTKQLLGYSGKGKFVVQLADLNQVVDGMGQLLRASIHRAVTLTFDLSRAPQLIEADVTQVRQVLLNLVTNAAEAIGERVGSVYVRTFTLEIDRAFVQRTGAQPAIEPGSYVCLEVEDTGCGMDDRVRSKLFDPFFTTKFAGRGLGLAAVLGIVTGHRGSIALRSTVGKGTAFSVYLPRAYGELPKPQPAPPSGVVHADATTILVVDDEKAVRAMTAVALESLGHEVLTAASGREACELYRVHHGRIRLVVLDLTMPEMNGEQTLVALQAIDPGVRALVMTGYAEEDVHQRFVPGQLAGFLMKPFARDELFSAVYNALRVTARQ